MSAADEGGKVRFWEYNRLNPDGSPVDVSKRTPLSHHLDQKNDAKLISDYSNPAFVLDCWQLQLAKTH